MKKGFSLVELVVIIVVVGVILSLGFIKYSSWNSRIKIENDTRLIYSIINRERMKAISERKSFEITAMDKRLIVKDQSANTTKTVFLNSPFSGSINIYPKGTMSKGSIVFEGDISLHPGVSCVTSDGLRLRMGQTYIDSSSGKRKCR